MPSEIDLSPAAGEPAPVEPQALVPYRPVAPAHPAMAVLMAITIIAAAFATAALAMAGAERFLGWTDPGAEPASPMEGGAPMRFLLFFLLLAQIGMTALTVAAVRLRGLSPVRVLALERPAQGWRAYALAVVGMAVAVTVTNTISYAVSPHDLVSDVKPFWGVAKSEQWWLLALVVVIGAPLSEEILFRGFLLPAFAVTALGFWGAALVTSLMWTGLHYGYSGTGLFEILSIGLFLSLVLRLTGSLRVTIFCHGAYNGLLLLALWLLPMP